MKKLAKGGSMTGGPGLTPRKQAGAAMTAAEKKKVMRKMTGAAATKAEKKKAK